MARATVFSQQSKRIRYLLLLLLVLLLLFLYCLMRTPFDAAVVVAAADQELYTKKKKKKKKAYPTATLVDLPVMTIPSSIIGLEAFAAMVEAEQQD